MIGCVGKAEADAIAMDESEMEDVRWVTREQLRAAVSRSAATDLSANGAGARVFDPVQNAGVTPAAELHAGSCGSSRLQGGQYERTKMVRSVLPLHVWRRWQLRRLDSICEQSLQAESPEKELNSFCAMPQVATAPRRATQISTSRRSGP